MVSMAANNTLQNSWLDMSLQITYISADTHPKVLARYKNKSKILQLHSEFKYANDQICIFMKNNEYIKKMVKNKRVYPQRYLQLSCELF